MQQIGLLGENSSVSTVSVHNSRNDFAPLAFCTAVTHREAYHTICPRSAELYSSV
ncbi:MAG: hypothetical protein LBS42_02420 [Tannerella sp.]|jgi:hypothetical protein|nr:hypothetical protein [Tannerella sp.]